jgi:ketosteroid isomerase-like protein
MTRSTTDRIMSLSRLAAACAVLACTPAGDGAVADSERQVLAAEDAYVAAELARDEAALRRLIDDRFTYNASDGTTSDKDALIRSVLGLHMTEQTITERSVAVEGNIAVVFGTTFMTFHPPDADERSSHLRYTSVYVKRDGGWRMLALHMSPRVPRS